MTLLTSILKKIQSLPKTFLFYLYFITDVIFLSNHIRNPGHIPIFFKIGNVFHGFLSQISNNVFLDFNVNT